MKVKAIVGFYDKVANKKRKQGEVFELPIARVNEINRKGRYIELVEETLPRKKENKN